MIMSKSRLEKFLYALYSLDHSDLPTPLSRIEELYKCLVTGEEAPTFEPLSRVEKYLMAILGVYDVDSLPNPLSRVEVLLYKLAIGDDNLDDVDSFLSKHEELLAEIIRNGGVGENINIEYVIYTLSTEHSTLYNTAKKTVKSAILKGNTKYRDIDTGDILDTFDETKNLELVSVKMPVLTTTGKNLFNESVNLFNVACSPNASNSWKSSTGGNRKSIRIRVKPNTKYTISKVGGDRFAIFTHNSDFDVDKTTVLDNFIVLNNELNTYTLTTPETAQYLIAYLQIDSNDLTNIQVVEGENTPYEPYKSNILTVNEEVELRGIGEVQDELDLLTGELTQRICEIALDGSEASWRDANAGQGDPVNTIRFVTDLKDKAISSLDIITDNFPLSNITSYNTDLETIQTTNGLLYVRILKSKLSSLSVDGFRAWLSKNPITVQYQLTTESVKTVDLSVVDQDGNDTELSTFDDLTHVTLSSEGAIPEAELEVATKNEEVLSTLSLRMDDIYAAQTTLEETSNTQSENVDATMFATTEIYEELL